MRSPGLCCKSIPLSPDVIEIYTELLSKAVHLLKLLSQGSWGGIMKRVKSSSVSLLEEWKGNGLNRRLWSSVSSVPWCGHQSSLQPGTLSVSGMSIRGSNKAIEIRIRDKTGVSNSATD
jgi:hypothetical protein